MKKEYIIPIFVPHLGCPNDCTFCNQKKISGQTKNVKAEDVKNTIEYYLNNFKDDNKYIEVAFFGGSFTGIDVDKQKELLSVAYEYIKNKKIDSIRISTRPDYINKEILKMLKSYGVKTIELGVQSTNDYILNKSKRGHTFEDVKKASKLIRKNGFILGHQMMVGLPESTRQDEINTAKDLIKLKPKIVRIYPVLVIKGTQLEKDYESGEYTPLTVEQAVETAKDLLVLFNKKKINVIRIGLQNTNEITDPNSKESQVVAGPYHPAFRQLVESRLWYDNIANEIKKVNSNVTHIQIDVNPSDINNAVGHKRINIEKINDTYNTDLKINPNSKIKKGKLKITKLIKYQEFIKENVK
jgi:radical SAM protein (TIGR01212 family)